MNNISLDNFNLQVGSKILLDNTKLIVSTKNKYALIGKNGCGKSSLINYINDNYKHLINIFLVEQDFNDDDTVYACLLKSDVNKYQIYQRLKVLDKYINDNDNNIEMLIEYNDMYKKYTELNMDRDESTIKSLLK